MQRSLLTVQTFCVIADFYSSEYILDRVSASFSIFSRSEAGFITSIWLPKERNNARSS